MKSENREVSARLAAVQRRFEHWRSTRTRLGRIPEPLWDSAVRCAAEYGVNRCARVLGLDYNRLKERLMAAKRSVSSRSGAPRFVELPSVGTPAVAECVVELESTAGTKVRLQLRGVAVAELIECAWRLAEKRR